MNGGVTLSKSFGQAARIFREDMDHLKAYVATPEGSAFLETIPVWSPDDWKSRNNRCYSFAIDRQNSYGVRPGELSGGIQRFGKLVQDFANSAHSGAVADGLVPLGHSFRNTTLSGAPVALFIAAHGDMGYDYHWIALRRAAKDRPDFVWAHKLGAVPAVLCSEIPFADSWLDENDHFAGYYAVPPALTRKIG